MSQRVHRCTIRSRRTTERERVRKRYRIVDYLKCIGNKPRRVTRCRPFVGPATSLRYRATLSGAIRLKVVSSSHISALTDGDGSIYTERSSKLFCGRDRGLKERKCDVREFWRSDGSCSLIASSKRQTNRHS